MPRVTHVPLFQVCPLNTTPRPRGSLLGELSLTDLKALHFLIWSGCFHHGAFGPPASGPGPWAQGTSCPFPGGGRAEVMQRVPCLGAVGLGDVQEGPSSHPGSGETVAGGPDPCLTVTAVGVGASIAISGSPHWLKDGHRAAPSSRGPWGRF